MKVIFTDEVPYKKKQSDTSHIHHDGFGGRAHGTPRSFSFHAVFKEYSVIGWRLLSGWRPVCEILDSPLFTTVFFVNGFCLQTQIIFTFSAISSRITFHDKKPPQDIITKQVYCERCKIF